MKEYQIEAKWENKALVIIKRKIRSKNMALAIAWFLLDYDDSDPAELNIREVK